ncbi:hypothetical protein TNCV_1129071 [Trichonephila clavipes]|nr:hypothetical protein TNCV_1129071 [Trichonephila clavipes]
MVCRVTVTYYPAARVSRTSTNLADNGQSITPQLFWTFPDTSSLVLGAQFETRLIVEDNSTPTRSNAPSTTENVLSVVQWGGAVGATPTT